MPTTDSYPPPPDRGELAKRASTRAAFRTAAGSCRIFAEGLLRGADVAGAVALVFMVANFRTDNRVLAEPVASAALVAAGLFVTGLVAKFVAYLLDIAAADVPVV